MEVTNYKTRTLINILFGFLGTLFIICLLAMDCSGSHSDVDETVETSVLSIHVLENFTVRGYDSKFRTQVSRITSQGHEYLITSSGGIVHMEHCLHRDINFGTDGD
jgi:hypothetical protein